MKSARKAAYIAGKITGDEKYMQKFKHAASILWNAGYIPLNPAKAQPLGLSNAQYIRVALAMLDGADLAVFLPDWCQSEGASLEMAYCRYVGKPIKMLAEIS